MALIFGSTCVDVAVVVTTCLVVAYLCFTNAFSYWEKRGVYYIQPTSFIGNLYTVARQKEHFGLYLKTIYDSNPGHHVIGLFAVRTPFLMVRDLNVVRNIMMTDAHLFIDKPVSNSRIADPLFTRSLFMLEGIKWKNMRVKLAPAFTSSKVRKMFYVMNECSKQFLQCIDEEMSAGKGVGVNDLVARYSTDVIASCAFGVNANALADPNCEFRVATRKIFEREKPNEFVSSLKNYAPWLIKLLRLKAFDDIVDIFIRKTFWDVAEYRKKNGITRGDFVDTMMQIKDEGQIQPEDAKDIEEIKELCKYVEERNRENEKLNIKLEDDDYPAQAFFVIAAGFHSSSLVVSVTLFELALNSAIQDQLRGEIQAVLDKHNSEVTYDVIAEMEYLHLVVLESLRKYPTLPVIERKCLSDYRIPGTDITIEEGIKVSIPVLAIYLDPTIYPEPEKFDPERFRPENRSKRPNIAHFPFGEGPRKCIGKQFGLMQVKTALVHILTTYVRQTVRRNAETSTGYETHRICLHSSEENSPGFREDQRRPTKGLT